MWDKVIIGTEIFRTKRHDKCMSKKFIRKIFPLLFALTLIDENTEKKTSINELQLRGIDRKLV